MSGYNLTSGRTPEQIEKMKKLAESGICAFCPEHFEEFHDNPIEFQTDHWIVSKNDYPYENTSLHLLLIAKAHVQKVGELSQSARGDFMEVIARVEKEFDLFSFGVGLRAGDFRYNGGSVDHLHAHVIVGDFTDTAKHQKVRFKMSSVPEPTQ
jgi:ATP adenylyltransferase